MQAASAEKARRLAEPALARGDLDRRLLALAEGTRELALRMMRQSPSWTKHACRAGCAFCCHTAVTIAGPEAFAIHDYLVTHYTAEELAEVRRRLDANAALAAGMTRDEYIAKLIPCGLLTEDGNCRAHPVRPMACAGFCSTSREACEAEFARVPGRGAVPADRFTMAAGLGASHGLKEACRRAGLDGTFYELHHALRRVFDEPDAAGRWARGEAVFAGCMT